jgi:hypothetical protein
MLLMVMAPAIALPGCAAEVWFRWRGNPEPDVPFCGVGINERRVTLLGCFGNTINLDSNVQNPPEIAFDANHWIR